MFFLVFFIFLSASYASNENQTINYFKFLKPEYKNIEFISESQSSVLGHELIALNECIVDYTHFSHKIKGYENRHYMYDLIREKKGRYILFYMGYSYKQIIKDDLPVYMGASAYYLYDLKEMKIITRQLMK